MTRKANMPLSDKKTNNHIMLGWLRAGVCRPCIETKLTATEKSAIDSD